MASDLDHIVPVGQKLTSRQWLAVLDRLSDRKTAVKPTGIELDLSEVQWIGHLPLLALCLGAQHAQEQHYARATALMPKNDNVRAFLHRWSFYDFLRSKQFKPVREPEVLYQQSFRESCVLPIRAFSKEAQLSDLVQGIQDTRAQVYQLLKTAAFLDDEGIRGLADVIVHELCANVAQHSQLAGEAFIFGRVSKQNDQVRSIYEKHAAPWETKFFQAVHCEGMTELVIGDAGLGIVPSLAEEAARHGKNTPEEILEWAFDPFSTSKRERSQHTRGLWAVRHKVRELRGVLYVRSYDGNGGGVSASWDFLNDPGAEVPAFATDHVNFRGTQIQILLPHLTIERPYTFISCDRAAASAGTRELRPVGFQIPAEPPARPDELGLREAIGGLGSHEVLFIDMSRMKQAAWDRKHVDTVGREISLFHALSDDVTSGLEAKFRRIWLLNPSDETLTRLRSSSWVTTLWQTHGILQPVARNDEDPSKPATVSFVVRDSQSRSADAGDTAVSRKELYRLISSAFGHDTVTRRSIDPSLTSDERTWLLIHLGMNAACVEMRGDAEGTIAPAFDVETLSAATVDALLPVTLDHKIEAAFAEQNSAPERPWYRLPSNRYCENYINPRLLADLDAPARNAMEKWIEQRVAEARAQYAISYTNFAPMLLTRATRANPAVLCLRPLKHYVPEEYKTLDDSIRPGSSVVLLVAVTGSARTIETILERLTARNVTTTVICLVNTLDGLSGQMPHLAEVERAGRLKCLLRKKIEIYDESAIAASLEVRPISAIDPETMAPVAPVRSFSSIISDGEFWSIAGEARGLSNEPITYKGRDFTTMFWMRNFFRCDGADPARATRLVLDHLEKTFGAPDIICANKETSEALLHTGARRCTRARFPNAIVTSEAEDTFLADTANLQGKHVVIFLAAAYSGSAITRLLKHFETAKRIHICVFVTRIAEPMIASFTRQPKVTFSAFRRLYSASSESSVGSSRTVRLQNLADYRPSCGSNRLLSFVEEQQREAERHVAAQNPDEMESVATPLDRPSDTLFQNGESYDFRADKGRSDLLSLVRRCKEKDAGWLSAVLEEAVSRAEILDRELRGDAMRDTRVRHLEDICNLYKAATNAVVKKTILDSLLLDRWHGREELIERGMVAFGHALLSDLRSAQVTHELRAACIRALSKVDRQRLIADLEQIVEVACADRSTELTLAVEMTKILDDEKASDHLRAGLQQIFQRRPAVEQSATDVALQCLLKDVGLRPDENGNIDFLPWKTMYEILDSEPPDPARTIRSLIRWIRSYLGPRARILYYRSEYKAGRFAYLDAWPRKEATSVQPVRTRNVVAAGLIDANRRDFFSGNVSDPSGKGYSLYYTKLNETDRADLKDNAVFVHAVGKYDVLRIFFDVSGGEPMPAGSVGKLSSAITDVERLLRRADSPLTPIGTFQYQETVRDFQTHPGAGGVDPLRQFLEHVHSLLGADIGSVLVLNDDGTHWQRDYVIGRTLEAEALSFPADDVTRVTVEAARERRPIVIRDPDDCRKQGFGFNPIVPWAPAWLALPLLEHLGCRVMLHLWHHIPGWFHQPQFSLSLLESLSSLGGGIAQIKADHEKARAAQRQEFSRIEVDRLAARLRNLTLIAGGLTTISREDRTTTHLDELALQVVGIHENVEALVRLVQQEEPVLPPDDLSTLVDSAVASARALYGEDKFEPPVVRGEPLAARVADPRMLSRVFTELLKNAKAHLKPAGKVCVDISYDDVAASVAIEIKNPGWGVEPERKLRIFEGNGVGLALAKVAARRHGGRIEEIGTPGENAIFRLTLPIARKEVRP